MRWKYWIHHEWIPERHEWAEAFVRPDHPSYQGGSFWVVIQCLGDPPGEDAGRPISGLGPADYARWADWLGDRPYRIARNGEVGDVDLLVRGHDFSRAEFLDWIKVWLRELELPISDLVAAPLEAFTGTHPHADLLHHIVGMAEAEKTDRRPPNPGSAPH